MSTPKNDIKAWSATLGRGRSVEFRNSTGKVALLLVLSIVMTLIALVMAGQDSIIWKIFGWIAVAFFALCIVVNIRNLFVRKPVLTVSPEGIAMTTAKAGLVPWSEISAIHPVTMNSNTFVELVITPEEAARQAAAGPTVAERQHEDGREEAVLWLPSTVAATKHALIKWLEDERQSRFGPTL